MAGRPAADRHAVLRWGPRKQITSVAWLLATVGVAVLSHDPTITTVFALTTAGIAATGFALVAELRRHSERLVAVSQSAADAVTAEVRRPRRRAAAAPRGASEPAGLAEVRRWSEALWAGYATVGRRELERLSTSRDASPQARSRAFLALARHAWNTGAVEEALRQVVLARVAHPPEGEQLLQPALEADFLMDLGRHEQARELLLRRPRPEDHDWLLQLANAHEDEQARLALLNQVFIRCGYAPLVAGDALDIDALHTSVEPGSARSEALVTVILPAFNAAATISTALRCLLQQTWGDLEVLVVDDASEDGTAEVVQRWAERDARVRLLRHNRNRGAYAARNTGLHAAAGSLVTVHDADDWSHAQKIETQARAVLDDPGCIAVMTHMARVAPDLTLRGQRALRSKTSPNFSSLLVRRSALDRVGDWDEVRVSADSEMVYRLQALYGEARVRRIERHVPLAFVRASERSLTSAGATDIHSLVQTSGARRQYRRAFQAWHASEGFAAALPWSASSSPRPFPCPELLRTDRDPAARAHLSLMVSADFSADAPGTQRALEEIRRGAQGPGTVGVVHHPRPEHVGDPLLPEVWGVVDGRDVRFVSSGERVTCDLLRVHDPADGRRWLSDLPEIDAGRVELAAQPSPTGVPPADGAASAARGPSSADHRPATCALEEAGPGPVGSGGTGRGTAEEVQVAAGAGGGDRLLPG